MIRKLAAVALAALAVRAHALDGASLEAGRAQDDTTAVRAALQWKWQRTWFDGGRWHVAGYWEASIAAWSAQTSDLVDYGFTPVFRLQRIDARGPYFEAAIGVHYLTEKQLSSTRASGTHFQFGDHLGAGWRFGRQERWDLSVRLMHLSNAGIRKPNPGIDFFLVRLATHFQ